MENASGWKSMNIDATIKKMFNLYKEKPVLFGGLVLLLNVPYYLLATYVLAPYLPIWLFLIVNIAAGLLIGLLTLGGLIHAADNTTAGKEVSIIECYKFAFPKLWQYIVLFFRIIWYTWAWVLILLVIIMGFTSASMVSELIEPFAATDTAYAQSDMMDFSDFEGMEGLEDFDFDSMGDFDFDTTGSMDLGSFSGMNRGGLPNFGALLTGGGILSIILGLAFIVVLVLVVIRSVRTVFSYYSLFGDAKTDSKAALAESIKLAKGNWWTIVGFALMAGFVMVLVTIALGIVAGLLFAIFPNIHFMLIVNMVIQSIVLPLPILFYYTFFNNMKKV